MCQGPAVNLQHVSFMFTVFAWLASVPPVSGNRASVSHPGTVHIIEMMVRHPLFLRMGVSDLTNQSRGIRWDCVSLPEVASANEIVQGPS